MKKKLSERDAEMIIVARKYLDDALHCIDYSDYEKKEIKDCMAWLDTLRK